MLRGPLGKENYKPKFSGHDTFPFRYAWLTKLAEFINENGSKGIKEFEKNKLANVVKFGVGLNMVKAIRHWGQSTNVCDESFELTNFGKKVFAAKKAFDPYLEDISTLWILHWTLASNPELTTWYYAFNYHDSIMFDRDKLTNDLLSVSKFSKWKGCSDNTIKRDVDCFVRTYTVSTKKGEITEDSLECPLAELNLISSTYSKTSYEFQRGPKPNLSFEVFEYALFDYFTEKLKGSEILTFEKIMYDFGSPGKVFQLDEKSLDNYLEQFEIRKNTAFSFIKGAGGLRQIQKVKDVSLDELLINCYLRNNKKAA
jgi:hypothetical protein